MLRKPGLTTNAAPHLISGVLVGLGPLAVMALISIVAAPSFGGPMFSEPPTTLFGVPDGLVLTVFAVLWGAIGGYVVATSRRPWVLPVALLVFTFPAIVAIVLGPAIILILQNRGA